MQTMQTAEAQMPSMPVNRIKPESKDNKNLSQPLNWMGERSG
jgi:hypothetical protein